MSQPNSKLSRRTLFAGAGAVGAVAAVATLLPNATQQAETVAEPKPAPEKGGGYRVTEHVKRYYKSTLI